MSQSAKFQEEICNQWNECERYEITNYRASNGLNPTSFKTFAWGYTRATQNALKILKNLIKENRLLFLESSTDEFATEMLYELNKKLMDTGDYPNDNKS